MRLATAGIALGLLLGCGDETGGTLGRGAAGSGGDAGMGGSGGSGGSGGDEVACADAPPIETRALAFDGDDSVSMGQAPSLAADVFTLEAWVRREGAGTEAGTGVGGVRLVPLITKGRGESDGSNVDCNYALGLVGDVLGADFEDYASGANHPVIGKRPLEMGRWHHVAATYDGSVWRLYLDGVLDGEAVADATPRYDSVQHFGLGTAYNSQGVAAGHFVGSLDEVRVYSRPLAESELRATMYSSTPSLDGLVGHFHLGGDTVVDETGNNDAITVTGTSIVEPGAVLDLGVAPTIGNPTADPAIDPGARLMVDVADADDDPIYVDFYAREITAEDELSIIILPDTQYYTRTGDDPSYFYAQTQWALDHRADRNVVGVCHVGDMVNVAATSSQWNVVENAFQILEDFTDPTLPDGMPYSPGVGNHDQSPNGSPAGTTAYNAHFGVDRFAGRSYFGGSYGGDNDDHWVRFRSRDFELIVVSFEYNPTPSAAELAWARRIFETHPRALGIVTSHSIVTSAGDFSGQGSAIYEALKDVPNVQLMASGHVSIDARRTDEFEGNVIHSMLSDYQRAFPDPNDPSNPIVGEQSTPNGGLGVMRIWTFSPADQRLYVESYSPREDMGYTDELNEFSLPVDLIGAGGPFVKLGTVAASEGQASIQLDDFDVGKTFEWYAVATDCMHQARTDVQLLSAESSSVAGGEQAP